jgi:hypothetical protein
MLSAQERDRERRNALRLLNLWDRVNVTRCREPRAESLPIIALNAYWNGSRFQSEGFTPCRGVFFDF